MVVLKKYHHVEENVFTPEECVRIQEIGEKDWESNKQSREGLGFRESIVSWIGNAGEGSWIYDKLLPLAESVKKKTWRTFKLKNLKPLQYTVYHAPYGKYDWHTDTADVNAPGDMAHRLLSFSVQLTNPNECYKGGDFELIEELHTNFKSARANDQFNFDKKVTVTPFNQGSVVFFPSIVVHRVTPVTEGTRKSLVGWIEGSFI